MIKKLNEDDLKFHNRKTEERVAKEQVLMIKESLNMRKKEIVDEIKALRENFRVKNNSESVSS